MRCCIPWRAILLCCATVAPLSAQGQVFVVDAANGPGTSFTDLPPAVAAAQSGDLLLVRPGDYTSFATSKGLTILGGNGVRIVRGQTFLDPAVVVSGLPVHETFTLFGVEASSMPSALQRFEVRACAGKVHLEALRSELGLGVWAQNSQPALLVEGSASVHLTRSRLRGQPGVLARSSTLVATDAECLGTQGFAGHGEAPSGHGIHAESSQISLSRCIAFGGSFPLFGPSSPTSIGSGLSSHLSTWTILGDETTWVAAGGAAGHVVPAMIGDGRVRKNPAVLFIPFGNAPAITPPITVSDLEIPSLRATGAPLGGTVELDLFGLAGDAFALFVGLPGNPVSLGSLGDLWIDLGLGPIFAGGGTLGASRHFAMAAAVPNEPLLLGVRFTWQGAGGSVANGFFLSNPGTYVHP